MAASTSESEVDLALAIFLESGTVPTSEALRTLVQLPRPLVVPELTAAVLDLRPYDQLLVQCEVRA